MALKPDQVLIVSDINFSMASAQTKGVLVCYSSTAGYVENKADPSGAKVAGILLVDVRNQDVRDAYGITSTTANYSKNQVPISGKVHLARVGEFLTSDVDSGDTFAMGNKLYITANGQFSNAQDSSDHEHVGHALAAKDSDGYLRVFVNIQ